MRKIIFFLVLLFITSCISNKELVYLQNDGKSQNLPIEVAESFSKPYRVQINDILNISLKATNPELVEMYTTTNQASSAQQTSMQNLYFNGFTVNDHGNIRIPVLGELNVLGYTIEEIQQTIEKKLLDEYLHKDSRLFVSVKLAGLRYTINGEISTPGTNILFQDKVTIMEAIANSGDITVTGDRKNVQIIRKVPQGYETHYLDLTNAKAMQSPYFYLQPNDYIYIKPLPQKSWGTGTTGIQTIGTIITAISLITTTLLLTGNL
ncbi:polysaccharide biosynthesis/export family protein [Flavobacterium sp.]|uniref:polysaccharide biosynthesis/export family protein n=1 Tax=Flavobacterium sp. TaxID=239 RepID=UPI0035281056